MKPRILVVDDDELNREVMETLLSAEYELEFAETGEEGLEKIETFKPVLILLDIMMPGIDGYEVCKRIKATEEGKRIQVMLVSAKAYAKERLKGYQVGADDYVVKPFNHDELLAKIAVQLRLREALIALELANQQIRGSNSRLQEEVEKRTKDVIATRDLTVFALARLAESRDSETGQHLERMREYTQILGSRLKEDGRFGDKIDDVFLENLYRSSPLHDIGKVGIPDVILLKPDRLSASEFDAMQRHTLIGAEALEVTVKSSACGGFLQMAADIARSHHERWDGTGYPHGMKGEAIPLSARIVALADVFDALTSKRCYKNASSLDVARLMIIRESGKHFDPDVVWAFEEDFDQFDKVHRAMTESTEERLVLSPSV